MNLVATPSRTYLDQWYLRHSSKPWRVLGTIVRAPALGEFWIDVRGKPRRVLRTRRLDEAVAVAKEMMQAGI
jgi:hypothetical protein